MVASQARPAYIYDTTLGDWVPMSGVVDTGQAYTFTANQTFNGLVTANNGINATSTLSLQTGGVNRLSINSNGLVTTPFTPAFHAFMNASGTTYTNTVVPFETTILNNGGHYSTANSRFTAPIAGIYEFHVAALVRAMSSTGYTEFGFRKNGSNIGQRGNAYIVSSGTGHSSGVITAVLSLSANDYVDVFSITQQAPCDFYGQGSLTTFQGKMIA